MTEAGRVSRVLDQASIKLARELRRLSGLPWAQIAERLGTTPNTVRRALDPEYVERMRAYERNRDRSDRRPARHAIPADTRTLTARLFGDPLPGRSALDRRAAP